MTTELKTSLQWYALRVHSKYEGRVSVVLSAKGYEDFLPLQRKRRLWVDRVKEFDVPLFPGYVFCRVDISERLLPILTTPGVLGFAGAGRVPIAIPEDQIAALKAIISSGLPSKPIPFVDVGWRVSVEDGPLAGLEGIVVRADKKCRLVVSVYLLQRSVEVEIDNDWVRPLARQIGPRLDPIVGMPAALQRWREGP